VGDDKKVTERRRSKHRENPMKLVLASLTVAAGLLASAGAFAQVPTGAPAGSTGLCKDGSYTSAEAKKGSCKGHKGVKDWYVATAATSATAPAMGASTPMGLPAKSGTPTATATPMTKSTPMSARTAAPGGGPGQVWVNTKSKVYHCQADKVYGKTKEGQYMTEDAAKAAGDHASHGKACTAA
jgi:hypothetical protein